MPLIIILVPRDGFWLVGRILVPRDGFWVGGGADFGLAGRCLLILIKQRSSNFRTPFCSAHLECCERVRPEAPIWDRFRIKVISGRAKMHLAVKFSFETVQLLVIWPQRLVKKVLFLIIFM